MYVPCSYAPAGLAEFQISAPRLTPWATFWRRSAPEMLICVDKPAFRSAPGGIRCLTTFRSGTLRSQTVCVIRNGDSLLLVVHWFRK